MVIPDPKQLLDNLKANATARKSHSLELIYHLLESQAEAEIKDFSIATIGKLSADAGDPSTQAIRNKGGEDYRVLIDIFAAAQGVTRKKPAGTYTNLATLQPFRKSLVAEPLVGQYG